MGALGPLQGIDPRTESNQRAKLFLHFTSQTQRHEILATSQHSPNVSNRVKMKLLFIEVLETRVSSISHPFKQSCTHQCIREFFLKCSHFGEILVNNEGLNG